MILADKIISLRKKAGWSQEELAQRLGVTRQSVSKWEGAQSVPDLDKLLQMSRLFGVSTDYLLKDELELPQPVAFVLWGAQAQKKAAVCAASAYPRLVLQAPHPSPLSACRGFFGSKPFSKINKFLTENGEKEIDWGTK